MWEAPGVPKAGLGDSAAEKVNWQGLLTAQINKCIALLNNVA